MEQRAQPKGALFCAITIAIVGLGIVFSTIPTRAAPPAGAHALPTRARPTDTPRPTRRPDNPTATPVPPTPTSAPPTSTPLPTPTFTPTPTPTPPPVNLAETELPARDVTLPDTGRIEVTLGQLDSGTQNLSREYPEARYTLGIPGHLEILAEGSYITLVTRHFPTVPDKPSALEIEVNGQLLAAISLTEENASAETQIDLPPGTLDNQENEIVVRLVTGATCDDPGAILKVVVDERSTLSFGYRQSGYPADLSKYPLPFAEQSLFSVPVTIVLADRHSESQLAAAATLAASLGKATGGLVDLQAITASDFDETYAGHHLIFIGRPQSHALIDELDPAAAITRIALDPDQGFLEQRASPWNEHRVLLIVSGRNDAGIAKAARVLSYQIRPASIRGTTARINQVAPAAGTPGEPPPQSYSLASLGAGTETFYGTRPQERDYTFYLPPGWKLTGPAVLTLRFSHASTIDPEQSVLDVRLNDQPVGSTFLNQDNAADGQWTLQLSQRLLQDGENRLHIGIELTLPGADEADRCRLLDDDRLWTRIDQNSLLSVPYSIVNPRPDLRYLPYPFGQVSGHSQTLFVLPDEYDATLRNDVVQLAALFGAVVQNDHLEANVLVANKFEREEWQDHYLILLGRPTQNALLGEFSDNLAWSFLPGSDSLTPASRGTPGLRLQMGEDATVGLIQLVQSPWNPMRAVLALTGTSDAGVHLAVRAFLNPAQSLRGNLVVVEALSAESDNPRIQMTDTRPAQPETPDTPGGSDPGETPAIPAMSDADKILLAEYWWK